MLIAQYASTKWWWQKQQQSCSSEIYDVKTQELWWGGHHANDWMEHVRLQVSFWLLNPTQSDSQSRDISYASEIPCLHKDTLFQCYQNTPLENDQDEREVPWVVVVAKAIQWLLWLLCGIQLLWKIWQWWIASCSSRRWHLGQSKLGKHLWTLFKKCHLPS